MAGGFKIPKSKPLGDLLLVEVQGNGDCESTGTDWGFGECVLCSGRGRGTDEGDSEVEQKNAYRSVSRVEDTNEVNCGGSQVSLSTSSSQLTAVDGGCVGLGWCKCAVQKIRGRKSDWTVGGGMRTEKLELQKFTRGLRSAQLRSGSSKAAGGGVLGQAHLEGEEGNW